MPPRAAKKSGRKSGTAVPGGFRRGGDPRQGRGPSKGAPNAGRPPDEFKALCAGLATRDETVAAVTAILDNPAHPHFMAALKWASDRGYGQATQSVDVNATVEHRDAPRQTWQVGDRVISWN